MGQLDGRVAVVTGASSGIGRACALRFAQEGAAVVGCARRASRLDELVEEIAMQGGEAIAVSCDVTNEDDIAAAVAAAAERFGRIDILGNFAHGFYETDPLALQSTTAESLLNQFVGGPVQSMLFMQQCFPYMKEQRYGRIINTSSGAWTLGMPDCAAYGMSKAGVEALTRHASQEWGPHGITTNTIYPLVMTPEQKEQYPENTTALTARIPLGFHGTPYDDLSPIVTLLVSEDGGYINGQSIGINGGMFFT